MAFFLIIDLIGIVYTTTAKATVLSPGFIKEELEDLDVYSKVRDEIRKEIRKENEQIAEIFDRTVSEGWMKKVAEDAIDDFLPYLKSETDSFELKVELVWLKENLKANLRLENFSPEALEWVEENVPDEIRIRMTPEQITLTGLPENFRLEENQEREVLDGLNTARQVVGYFYLASTLMLILAAVFILLIIALSRKVRSICRTLGISAIISGIISFVIAVLVMNLASSALATAEMPELITKEEVLGVVGDILAMAKTLAMALAVVGAALVAVSILYGRRPAKPEQLKRR